MSRCCCKKDVTYAPTFVGKPTNNCICNFPTLVILILIVLQFSKNKCDDGYGDNHGKQQVGNGVLFIIALFFLSCSGCGKGAY